MAVSSTNLADVSPPVCGLDIANSFSKLTPTEQLYAHWQAQAGWAGARIIMAQNSHDGQRIIELLLALVAEEGKGDGQKKLVDLAQLFEKAGLDKGEQTGFLEYVAQTFGNLANYRSFGHSKFIPRIEEAKFEAIVKASANTGKASALWDEARKAIYSVTPSSETAIGKPSLGAISGYYPPLTSDFKAAFGDEDADQVQAALEELKVDPLNTRVVGGSRETGWEVRVASVEKGEMELKGKKGGEVGVKITKGDFSEELKRVCEALVEAKKYAANEHQSGMIDDYIRSFTTGSIADHVEGSTKWVKDIGPVVETYLGFIESYVDPWGARAEWEGFTAIVNKELSAKYEKLVDRAPELIKDLPWGADFEVDEFKRPDFTALEIVSFATGGIPAGINIPNYFSVRDSHGFKNVSLANILAAKDPNEKMTFLHPDDVPLYKRLDGKAFELQVANHELLGHGSGKLFQQAEDGSVNFDKSIKNPLNGKDITTFYKPGQTYGSVLGTCSSSYEECRAEAVALYLASNDEILRLFKYETKEDQEDIITITFLLMARAGVRALEFYDPATKKHGQAHMQARMGITNALVRDGIAILTEKRDESGKLVDAYIRVDREKVLSQGRECMSKLLKELQVRKCIADGEGARKFYTDLTNPLPGWDTELRDLVIAKKAPRKLFVQPNTFVKADGSVELRDYPLTLEGVLQSFVERVI